MGSQSQNPLAASCPSAAEEMSGHCSSSCVFNQGYMFIGLFLHSWLAGNKTAHFITLHYNWWLSFFVFFPQCAIPWWFSIWVISQTDEWNRSSRFGKVPSGGSDQQGSAPAWDAEMQWGQSKAMISGLWNCDLSLLPVCRIDLTGWHSAFWTSSCLWAYWVIFVMTRKALFLSLLFLRPIPYSPPSGSKICVQSPDKVIWGRSSRRGDDVPSHPAFADRFCPRTSSPLRYNRGVGEKNACQRPHPVPFLQACGTQTVGWRKLCLSWRWIKLSHCCGWSYTCPIIPGCSVWFEDFHSVF